MNYLVFGQGHTMPVISKTPNSFITASYKPRISYKKRFVYNCHF